MPRNILELLAMALLIGSPGCRALPLVEVDDDASLQVQLLKLSSTRALERGMRSRFVVKITNESQRAIEIDRLSIVLEATSNGSHRTHLYSSTFQYPDLAGQKLLPGKFMRIPVAPERHEFPLDVQQPGRYEVRAKVLGRFVSEPIPVVVFELQGGGEGASVKSRGRRGYGPR